MCIRDRYDDYENDNNEIKTFTRESNSLKSFGAYSKRPLEAISLRQPKNFQTTEQKKLPYGKEVNNQDWPDELDFKVERWQRSSEKESDIIRDQLNQRGGSKSRNLPRSRRRRV